MAILLDFKTLKRINLISAQFGEGDINERNPPIRSAIFSRIRDESSTSVLKLLLNGEIGDATVYFEKTTGGWKAELKSATINTLSSPDGISETFGMSFDAFFTSKW